MKFLAHINVPGNAVEEMRTKYGMLSYDIQLALEAYMEELLSNWDDGPITFFQFLEKDLSGKKYFTNKK